MKAEALVCLQGFGFAWTRAKANPRLLAQTSRFTTVLSEAVFLVGIGTIQPPDQGEMVKSF